MTDVTVTAMAVAAGTLLAAGAYRAIWKRSGDQRTPTGFGFILAPLLLLAAWLGGATIPLLAIFAAILIATMIYWFDDLMGLSAWIRVWIAAGTGMAVALGLLLYADYPPLVLATLAFFSGFVAVGLVNMVNFQDGADLNLSLFIILTACFTVLHASVDGLWSWIGWVCLAVAVPFSLVNARPNSLYFGDSGSFAFGLLLTIMGVAFLFGDAPPPPEAAIPAALPFVDAFWVTMIRIRIRQRFTVRHYFHLYQRLQRDLGGHFYLIPQIANALLCLGLARILEISGLERVPSIIVAMIFVTIPFFVFCHNYFVHGEPGPPGRRA